MTGTAPSVRTSEASSSLVSMSLGGGLSAAQAAAQEAAIGMLKMSPSMSLGQLPLEAGKGGPLNLTPYLATSPFNTSPWSMMVAMDAGFKLTPTMAGTKMGGGAGAAVGQPNTYRHHSEHNKFAQSFASALTEDDGEVPNMSRPATPEYEPVPMTTTSSVPSRSRSKSKSTPSSAGRAVPGKAARGKSKSKGESKGETKAPKKKTAGVKRAGKSGATGAKDMKEKEKKKRPEEKRREKRREQNRVNAAKCRQRKVDKVNVLQDQLDDLVAENTTLRKSFVDLERKLKAVYAK